MRRYWANSSIRVPCALRTDESWAMLTSFSLSSEIQCQAAIEHPWDARAIRQQANSNSREFKDNSPWDFRKVQQDFTSYLPTGKIQSLSSENWISEWATCGCSPCEHSTPFAARSSESVYPAQCAGSSHQRDTSERGLPYGNAEWQTRRPSAHEIAHGSGRSKVSWALRKIW